MARPEADGSILIVREMNRFFGGLHAVNSVSFEVKKGIIKAIIGPNGAGKTTLFNLLSGSLKPSSGEALFLGDRITGLKSHEIARKGLSRTFQDIRLCAKMTVLENVMLGRHTRSRAGFAAGLFALPWTWREEAEIRHSSLEILEFMAVSDLAHEEVGNLPFGKQRLVEFARALAAEPALLLLDEPASGLNLHETSELAGLIVKIKDGGTTVLLVEHDMSLVMDISEEIVVLSYGRKIAEGAPQAIQSDRQVINIYLGEDDA